MSDQPETNLDLLDAPEPLRTDGPTLAEFVAAGYLAENYPPKGYAAKDAEEVEPIPAPVFLEANTAEVFAEANQHAESGYRPVTGAEVKDYLDAKGMGLEGRPSKAQVSAFLAAKRGK